MFRFIHISDTHIGPTDEHLIFDLPSYPPAQVLVEALGRLPFDYDFILHTGDVVADPDARSYALVDSLFEPLKKPVYYVTGNHDDSLDVARLRSGPLNRFDVEGDAFAYQAELKNCRLLVFDGKGPEELGARGRLSEEQFEVLEMELSSSDRRTVIGFHFPARLQDSSWLNDQMLLEEGDRFHAILARYSSQIVGVFSGHVHRSMQVHEDGVFYSSVGSSFCGFRGWPSDETYHAIPAEVGIFHLVTVDGGRVTVKQYRAEEL